MDYLQRDQENTSGGKSHGDNPQPELNKASYYDQEVPLEKQNIVNEADPSCLQQNIIDGDEYEDDNDREIARQAALLQERMKRGVPKKKLLLKKDETWKYITDGGSTYDYFSDYFRPKEDSENNK